VEAAGGGGVGVSGGVGGVWARVGRELLGTAMSRAMARTATERVSIPMLFPAWDLGMLTHADACWRMRTYADAC
jgi:hypothetical protein